MPLSLEWARRCEGIIEGHAVRCITRNQHLVGTGASYKATRVLQSCSVLPSAMSASSSSVVAPVPASLLTQTNDGLSSIDSVVQQITSSTDPTTLIQQLNNSAPKDVRDNVLSSILSSRQDPLDVLDPAQHTLGYLYILYVSCLVDIHV